MTRAPAETATPTLASADGTATSPVLLSAFADELAYATSLAVRAGELQMGRYERLD